MKHIRKKKDTYVSTLISVCVIVIASVVIVFLSNEEFLMQSGTTVNHAMAVAMAVVALLVGVLIFVHRNFRK